MRKFLLSAIGLFVAVCTANQISTTRPPMHPNKLFTDSLPKDGTVVLYKNLPQDHTITDTMLRNQRLYKNGFKALRVF